MKVSGRSFSVVGMGRSGLAAAAALAARGADVLLSDGRDTPDLRRAAGTLDPHVRCAFGREEIRPGDIAVLSPGIPPSAPVFRHAYRVADDVMGEVELFFRLFPGTTLAVTGTDGKSTVTTMLAHLLRAAGRDAIAAGNLGNALCDLLADATPDTIAVAEVSCFQLITTSRFRPQVALVTNLAEDHLEYHGDMAAYVAAKARVVARQAAGDAFVRNLDDPILRDWLRPGCAAAPGNGQRVLEVSQQQAVDDGVYVRDGAFVLATGGVATAICPRADLALPGAHNTENALLALAAAAATGAPADALARGLATYRGLPHRIEPVGTLHGVRFYNDSKATNPHAAVTGLRAFDEPVVLIAGGHEKHLPLHEMADAIARRCAAVVLVGESAERMRGAFAGRAPLQVVDTMEAAVRAALELARPAGVVLLSPGASSFDRYAGFEQRGDHFRAIVRSLIDEADRAARTC
jgi:UDP-N-acetylmuramoylalanine--D-glutamate ligase